MKNKKGFTLIELIVTIVLLAILALIIILNLNSNLKKQRAKDYIVFTEKVKAATNVYWSAGEISQPLIETDDYIIISVEDLANTGLISMETLIDPESNLSLNDSIEEKKYVKIYKDDSAADFIEYPIKDTSDIFWHYTYELNGGTGCESSKVLKGQNINLCTPTKTKANFVGWYLDEGLTNKITTSTYKPETNVTLYAKWEHFYNITYNLEEALKSQCSNIIKVIEGNQITLCNPTKTHYTLEGWYDSSSLSNKIGNPNANITPSKDLNLYPKWIRNSYTITFNLNGGTNGDCTTATLNKTIMGGNAIGSLCKPQKSYNTFKGWFTTTTGNTRYTESSIPDKSMTLYAQWSPITYTITYQNNGGSGCSSSVVNAGESLGTKLCTPTKTGYNFNGWLDSSNKSVTSSTVPTSNLTLTAQWELTVPSAPNLTLSPYSNLSSGTSVTATLSWDTNNVVTHYCITSSSSSSSCSWVEAPSSGTVSKSVTISGSPGATVYYYGFLKNEKGISQSGRDSATIKQTTTTTTTTTTVAPCSSTSASTTKTWSDCVYIGGGNYMFPKICTSYYSTINGQYCGDGGCTDYYGQAAYASTCSGSGGGSTSGTNCYDGGSLNYVSGFTCYPVCYQQMNLIQYGPMADGSYDWGCYSGWTDTGSYCYRYYCPS